MRVAIVMLLPACVMCLLTYSIERGDKGPASTRYFRPTACCLVIPLDSRAAKLAMSDVEGCR